jgi:phosphatidylethanolamine-binding protein (PEBP) family uncharacterized protein
MIRTHLLDAIAIGSYGIFFPKQLYRKIAFLASKAEILWGKIIYRSLPSSGIHQYHFKVYALDIKLVHVASSTNEKLMAAMGPHIISSGELLGLYEK